jgi:signal transduction histidine kinase
MTSDISSDLHALSHELHSSTLEYLGLAKGMKSWCEEYGERYKLEIDFKSQDVPDLPQDVSLCLFRVLQEAVHNATKYSGVDRIEVQLTEIAGEIHLIVRDSGRGFEIEAQGKREVWVLRACRSEFGWLVEPS